jgi:hypothetical protein
MSNSSKVFIYLVINLFKLDDSGKEGEKVEKTRNLLAI